MNNYNLTLEQVKEKIVHDNSIYEMFINNRIEKINNFSFISNVIAITLFFINTICHVLIINYDIKNLDYHELLLNTSLLLFFVIIVFMISKEFIVHKAYKNISISFIQYKKFIILNSLKYYVNYDKLSEKEIKLLIDNQLIPLVGLTIDNDNE